MGKIFRIISKILSTVLVISAVFLAVFLVGVRIVGLTPYTVLSGSMEPYYHVGSIIYVKDIPADKLKINDPLTFRLQNGTIATHRIVEIIGEGTSELSFRTMGDANDTPDGITPASRVIGKPVFSIPYLGFVSKFIQTRAGLICSVCVAAAILVVSLIIDTVFPKKKDDEPVLEENKNIG